MINSFYQKIIEAQAWFFGDLLNDAFFASCVQIFNALIMFSLFYGVIIYPLRWAVALLVRRIKGVNDDD